MTTNYPGMLCLIEPYTHWIQLPMFIPCTDGELSVTLITTKLIYNVSARGVTAVCHIITVAVTW